MRNLSATNGCVKPLSKADQIRQLLHLRNEVIAERLGYASAYVRAVRDRTSHSGLPVARPADKNYDRRDYDRTYWLDVRKPKLAREAAQ